MNTLSIAAPYMKAPPRLRTVFNNDITLLFKLVCCYAKRPQVGLRYSCTFSHVICIPGALSSQHTVAKYFALFSPATVDSEAVICALGFYLHLLLVGNKVYSLNDGCSQAYIPIYMFCGSTQHSSWELLIMSQAFLTKC